MVAHAYMENVTKLHGFPEDVVFDRNGTFTGEYFTDLYDNLRINKSMSNVYHPQMDSQTERIYLLIKSYLRAYCNYKQNDCASMLAMVEYSYNKLNHFTTKISPYDANCGLEPTTSRPMDIKCRNPASEL